ncbi:hypothetical protein [Dyadobacter frigoris]|uniref:Uncharacterized protein n=1 Tax=Dyadobacter frigoris TaxID=2576211 RepID=A0A4U6D8T5_9BACT|nr:hypothetical protein [Dyadobacter frigoris]TKT92677.1 hypothetical protein FDK13_07640 [Dyadobacter frigoris]
MSKFSQIKIDPNGGPITVDVVFNGIIVATYDYYLWSTTNSAYIDHKPGNNLDTKSDTYTLPMPTSINVGRMIEVRSHFAAPTPPETAEKYKVSAVLRQDGKVLGSADDTGAVDSNGNVQFTQLLIKMI